MPPRADPVRLHPRTVERLHDALVTRRNEARVPALSAAVGRAGDVVWAEVADTDGAVTTGHAFRIGSITKPMVAVAVLRLVAENLLTLDDPISAHLPDAPAGTALIRHFLTHTTGLPAEPTGPWWERSTGRSWEDLAALDLQPLWPAGVRYHYSNVGYGVLGRLLEVVRGRPWADCLRDELWLPLGMTSIGRDPVGPAATGWAVHPDAPLVHPEPVQDYGAMGPAGAVWSTPSDLVRFGMWLGSADPNEDRVLSADQRLRIREPRVLVDEPGLGWTAAYGLGPRITNHAGFRTVGHSGSVPGFTADLRCHLDTGDTVAMCSSATNDVTDVTPMLQTLVENQPRHLDAFAGAEGHTELADLCGHWYWGPNPYRVSLLPGPRIQMTAAYTQGRGTVFGRLGGKWLGVEGGYWLGEELRATRDHSGRPIALNVGTFHLSRIPYDPETAVPGGAQEWRPLPSAPLRDAPLPPPP